MPKMIGNNRPSALKRLSAPYSTTKIDRRPTVGLKPSSINDARQILVNRNQTSFDARQLLSRQASKTSADDDGQMVVVTGLKDMKMKDGRVRKTFDEERELIRSFSWFQRPLWSMRKKRKRRRFMPLEHQRL